MPDPALPIAPPVATATNFEREYVDLLGRAYAGTVTVRRIEPAPPLSLAGTLVNGKIALSLPPGRYSVGAMLKDVDGVRAYQADEVTVE